MKNRILAVTILLIVSLALILIVNAFSLPFDSLLDESRYQSKPMLSDEEKKVLRRTYTRYDSDMMPVPSLQVANIENPDRHRITRDDTHIYCEILSEPVWYFDGEYSDYYVPVKVIADTENLFVLNSEIVLRMSLSDSLIYDFKAGDKFILPIEVTYWNGEEGVFRIDWGVYYVTEDGYCLSVFSEYDCRLSGLSLPETLKKLKKTPEEFSKYLELQEKSFEYHGMRNYDGFKNTVNFKYKLMNEERLNKSINKK